MSETAASADKPGLAILVPVNRTTGHPAQARSQSVARHKRATAMRALEPSLVALHKLQLKYLHICTKISELDGERLKYSDMTVFDEWAEAWIRRAQALLHKVSSPKLAFPSDLSPHLIADGHRFVHALIAWNGHLLPPTRPDVSAASTTDGHSDRPVDAATMKIETPNVLGVPQSSELESVIGSDRDEALSTQVSSAAEFEDDGEPAKSNDDHSEEPPATGFHRYTEEEKRLWYKSLYDGIGQFPKTEHNFGPPYLCKLLLSDDPKKHRYFKSADGLFDFDNKRNYINVRRLREKIIHPFKLINSRDFKMHGQYRWPHKADNWGLEPLWFDRDEGPITLAIPSKGHPLLCRI